MAGGEYKFFLHISTYVHMSLFIIVFFQNTKVKAIIKDELLGAK